MHLLPDLKRDAAVDLFMMVAFDADMGVAVHLLQAVLLDDQMTVGADPLTAAGLDADIEVLLGVEKDLLLALFVLEAQLVEAASAGRGAGFEGGAGLGPRQGIGRHGVGVVDEAGDQGTIRVALKEIDDHLHPHPRQQLGAPLASGPGLGDTNPARAFLVILAAAVPVELYLHPAVFVGVDFLSRRPHHHGGLGAVDHRPRRHPRRAEGSGGGHAGETVAVVGLPAPAAEVGGGGGVVLEGDDGVGLVGLARAVVAGEGELAAGEQSAAVAGGGDGVEAALLLLDPHLGEGVALGLLLVKAGVIIKLEMLDAGHLDHGFGLGGEIEPRGLKIELAMSPGAGEKLVAVFPARDAVLVDGRSAVLDLGFRTRPEGGGAIGHNQSVLAVIVSEVIEDAFFLE